MEERKMKQVFQKVWESMRKAVPASSTAQSYVTTRGWNYKLLKIGYASKNITQNFNKADHDLLIETGLLTKYNQHANSTPLKDCIVFPLQDQKENITGFYGRKLKDAFNKHVFIREEHGIFPSWPKPETEKLILTTSVSDAAALLQLDFIRNEYAILAIHGFSGIKQIHKAAILSITNLTQVVISSPDSFKQDEISEAIQALKPEVKINTVTLPIGEDIAILLQAGQKNAIQLLFQFSTYQHPIEIKCEEYTPKEITLPKGEFNSENPQELIYKTSNAIYRVLGGVCENMASMKVTLSVHHSIQELKFHRNKVELYSNDDILKEAIKIGSSLGINSEILNMELTYLSGLLETYRKEKGRRKDAVQNVPQLTENTIAEAKNFLSSKGLFYSIDKIIEGAGIVGEKESRMLVFVIASSYKMPYQLHGVILGDSASGKTNLMNTITGMIPKEDHLSFTRITEGSLYNLDEYELYKKLLTIEDRTGLEEKAEYALRELQSKRELRSLVTVKNESGEYGTQFRTVKAAMASLSCSTASISLTDDENRCFMILVDQSKAQTNRIIEYQNKVYAGKIDLQKQTKDKAFLQNCVRILQPYQVINHFAERIELPDSARNKRRLNQLYFCLVNQITLLHQFQREKDSQGRLISQIEDLEIANKILFDAIVMKADVLEDGILRHFLEMLKVHVGKEKQQKKFTSRTIIESFKISKSKVCDHLTKLVDAEFLIRTGSANRGYEYEIAHTDDFQQQQEAIRRHLDNQIEKLKV